MNKKKKTKDEIKNWNPQKLYNLNAKIIRKQSKNSLTIIIYVFCWISLKHLTYRHWKRHTNDHKKKIERRQTNANLDSSHRIVIIFHTKKNLFFPIKLYEIRLFSFNFLLFSNKLIKHKAHPKQRSISKILPNKMEKKKHNFYIQTDQNRCFEKKKKKKIQTKHSKMIKFNYSQRNREWFIFLCLAIE